jgi:hypothetical protein
MIIMRIPQHVSERVKEAPAQALRAVFSGIGQVLLVADRIKSRAAEPARSQGPATTGRPGPSGPNGPAGPAGPAAAPPKDETRWRSLDETGNVRLLSRDNTPARSAAAEPEPTVAPEPEPEPEPEPAAASAPDRAAAGVTAAGPALAALPVANYDDLTLASLRARLRNLDSGQVRVLLEYEKANAGRAPVLTMFERRIAKLESEA